MLLLPSAFDDIDAPFFHVLQLDKPDCWVKHDNCIDSLAPVRMNNDNNEINLIEEPDIIPQNGKCVPHMLQFPSGVAPVSGFR
jgi:hypothetical protein